ncbi:hypothetical protein evm_007934 [Chilo suppressalis]|nr:hypothetical protein evm_007934 [Chilo suppressalis]
MTINKAQGQTFRVVGVDLGVSCFSHGNDHIVFPGPIQEVPLNRYGSDQNEIPEECKHLTYCTIKPADYPQEKFNNLFKEARPLQQTNLVLSDLNDRQGDPEDIDNCETLVTFDVIYKVQSKTGEWRTVVQSPEKNYVQRVRMEKCMQEKEPCFTIYLGLPGYTTYCKQQYTTWEFVVEATDGSDNTEKIATDLPTCCSCHYKKVKNL